MEAASAGGKCSSVDMISANAAMPFAIAKSSEIESGMCNSTAAVVAAMVAGCFGVPLKVWL